MYRTPATVPVYDELKYVPRYFLVADSDRERIQEEIASKPESTLRQVAERWGLPEARTRPFADVFAFHVDQALGEFVQKRARSERVHRQRPRRERLSLFARIKSWLRSVFKRSPEGTT